MLLLLLLLRRHLGLGDLPRLGRKRQTARAALWGLPLLLVWLLLLDPIHTGGTAVRVPLVVWLKLLLLVHHVAEHLGLLRHLLLLHQHLLVAC